MAQLDPSTTLSRICSNCRFVNQTPTDYCLNCGAPLGRFPELEKSADDEAKQPWLVFGIESTFVGRETELARLNAHVESAIKDGRGGILMIRGPEGIGKSRLVDALNVMLDERGSEALLIRGHGNESDGRPYRIVRDLLANRFYLDDNAGDDEWRRRLEEGTRAIVGEDCYTEIAHRIGALIGVRFPGSPWARSGADVEEANRAALVELLASDSEATPLVVVFDDIDYVGPEGLAVISMLCDRARSLPIAVVIVASETWSPNAIGRSDDHDDLDQMVLEPLSDEQIMDLTRALLIRVPDIPDDVVRRVAERAVGNPFVAEEIVRILIAEAVIDTRGNEWSVDMEGFTALEVPFDFEDVVRARLNQLAPEELELLQEAAMVGKTFWLGALLVLRRSEAGGDESAEALWMDKTTLRELQSRLDALVTRDIIIEHPRSALDNENEYVFKHGVERRLLLEDVDAQRAEAAHRAIAQWMLVQSENHPERFLLDIADHFHRGGMHSRSARFYRRAGDLAQRRYLNERAAQAYQKALDIAPTHDVDQRLQLLHDLGSTFDRMGDYERSIPVFEALGRLSWRVASRSKGGVAFNKLGRAFRSLGEYDKAIRYLDRAHELFDSVEDTAGIASTLDDIGRVYWLRGEYEEAHKRYETALDLRRTLGDQRSIALSLSRIGMLRVQRGEFREALAHFREALELRRDAGDLQGIAESLNTIGVIFVERGDTESAIRLFIEALDTAREAGDRSQQSILLNNLGEVELSRGSLDDAEEYLREAASIAERTGDRRVVFDATRNLGVLQSRKGHHALAVDHVEEALEMAREMGSRVMEGVALRTLGELHGQTVFDSSAEGQSGADSAFRSAIEIFDQLGNESELGRSYHSYGTYLLEQGLLVQGKKHLEMAKDIFERLEMRRILADTTNTIDALS